MLHALMVAVISRGAIYYRPRSIGIRTHSTSQLAEELEAGQNSR